LLYGLIGATLLAISRDVRPVYAVLVLWTSAAYAICGMVAWSRRPRNAFGLRMIVTGFCALATTLSWSSAPLLQTIGLALDVVPLVLIVHVFLAFPTGRTRGRADRIVVRVGYVAAIGGQLAVLLLGGPGASGPLNVIRARDAATVLHNVELVVISAVALTGVALLIKRRLAEGRPLRRSLALLIDSFGLGLVMIAVLLVVGVLGGPAFATVQQVSLGMLGLAPVAFLAGLLTSQISWRAHATTSPSPWRSCADSRGACTHQFSARTDSPLRWNL
jgi:hypothetical protein